MTPSLRNIAGYKEFNADINGRVGTVTNVTVKNVSGATITAGSVVYLSGSDGTYPTVANAKANAMATMPAFGIVAADILNNAIGTMRFSGILSGINASAYSVGDRLYVSGATAGLLTKTEPVHPFISQLIAVVISNATDGAIYVFPGFDPHGAELGTLANSFKLGDATAGAKILSFVANFIGSLSWTPTAVRILTLPDATDTLVGKATTDILTNKSVDLANNIVAGTAAQFNTALTDGEFVTVPEGTTFSGRYTPALTNVANLTASAAYQCQWLRVGNTVTVSGKVDVTPTAAVSTKLGIALPVASALAAAGDCAGCAASNGVASQSAAILGDTANARAQMEWIAVDVTNKAMYFNFTYTIL